MFRGYRSAIVAVGLTVLTTLAYSQELPDTALEGEPIAEPGQAESATTGQDDGAGEQQQPIDYSSIFNRIEAAIRDLIPEIDEDQGQRQQNREVADLEAQQDMALWAKAMFRATVAGVAVTFVGIVLIGWTLHHTRRAADSARDMVEEAKLATAAANETVNVTRRMGGQQLRAYVAAEPYGAQMIGDPGGNAIASVGIRNVGNIPAHKVAWKIKCEFSAAKRRADFPVTDDEAEGHNSLPPRTVMVQGSPQFVGRSMQYGSPDLYLYVWGIVLYEDGFGKDRFIRFCHRYNCVNFDGNRIREEFGRFHRYGNDAN